EDHDARRCDTLDHGFKKVLHLDHPADIVKSLAATPDTQSRRLFDHLTLALPQSWRVEAAFAERHGHSLLGRKSRQADQRVDGFLHHFGSWFRQARLAK